MKNIDNRNTSMLEMIEQAEEIENGIEALAIINAAQEEYSYTHHIEAVDWVISHILDDMQTLRANMTCKFVAEKKQDAAGA